MSDLSIELEFKTNEFTGEAKSGVNFYYLESNKVIHRSSEFSITLDENGYSKVPFTFSLDVKAFALFKAVPFLKQGDKSFFISPFYYYYDNENNEYFPVKVTYTNDLQQPTIKDKPSYNLDINYKSPKTLVPNPTPNQFSRYDTASFFDDSSLTFNNEEDFSPKLESIQIISSTIPSIDLSTSFPILKLIKTNLVVYTSLQIDLYYSLRGLNRVYKDFFFIDIFIDKVKRLEYPTNLNKEFKTIIISNLSFNNSISLGMRYKKRMLKRTKEVIFNNDYDRNRIKKIISYDN